MEFLTEAMNNLKSLSPSLKHTTYMWIVDKVFQQTCQDTDILQPSASDSNVIYRVLKLWNSVLRNLPHSCLEYKDIETVYILAETSLFSASKHLWNVGRLNRGHLICRQFLKVIKTIFKSRNEITVKTFFAKIALQFLRLSPNLFSQGHINELFVKTDFVSCCIEADDVMNDGTCASVLMKSLVLTLLEACVIVMDDISQTSKPAVVFMSYILGQKKMIVRLG